MKNVDIRGDGGFVVGPGSRIDGVSYDILMDNPIAQAPAWFSAIAKSHDKKESAITDTAEYDDTDVAVMRAAEYAATAEPAYEGAGGDRATFAVAAMMRDLGVSGGYGPRTATGQLEYAL